MLSLEILIPSIIGGIGTITTGLYKIHKKYNNEKDLSKIKINGEVIYYNNLLTHDIFNILEINFNNNIYSDDNITNIINYYVNTMLKMISRKIFKFISDKKRLKLIDDVELAEKYFSFLSITKIIDHLELSIHSNSNSKDGSNSETELERIIVKNKLYKIFHKYFKINYIREYKILYRIMVKNFIHDDINKDVYYLNYLFLNVLKSIMEMYIINLNQDSFLKLKEDISRKMEIDIQSDFTDRISESEQCDYKFKRIDTINFEDCCPKLLMLEISEEGKIEESYMEHITNYNNSIYGKEFIDIIKKKNKYQKFSRGKSTKLKCDIISGNNDLVPVIILKVDTMCNVFLDKAKYKKLIRKRSI